jgi:MoaA/NifB/PqqE/SkfB family radical SAM enzyme
VNLKFDVEADWILLKTCNLRCKYCFFPPHILSSRIITSGTSSQWLEGFNVTQKTWLLHITGGEPSIYPGFVDLCQHLTQNHFLSINSNLSHGCMDIFAEKINPERVHFINAAVHYDESRSNALRDIFIKRVHKLRSYMFIVFVSLVMTPEIVEIYPKISEYYESQGISLIPKVMRGKYKGRKFPASYSSDQKSYILEFLMDAQRKYASVIAGMDEQPTINPLNDDSMLKCPGNYYGKICGSGYNFVRIEPDGTVLRCSSRIHLGNILQKNIKLLRFPIPCFSITYCPYFCEKYTSPQFVPKQENRGISLYNSLSYWIKRIFLT